MDKTAITELDRAVYAAAYDNRDALRAVRGWFSAFSQDIADAQTYAPLAMPVLGLGGISYDFLAAFLRSAAPGARVVKMENTGHWIPDEKPPEVAALLTEFLGAC